MTTKGSEAARKAWNNIQSASRFVLAARDGLVTGRMRWDRPMVVETPQEDPFDVLEIETGTSGLRRTYHDVL